ncbi:MAG: prepilin-type N-terminal cleavage/methylation domain-containing protein [Opitutales bacterium]
MKKNSKKGFTLVEIMIVVVIIGLLAAMAIPAFQKVRTTSQDKAIMNNLRQIASAAQQYFLEEGATSVNVSDLVGANSYITSIKTVKGETYPTSVSSSDTQIAVTGTDTTTYDF